MVGPSVWAALVPRILEFAQAQGLERDALLASANLRNSDISHPHARVPQKAVGDIIEAAAKHIDHIGLGLAQHFNGWNQHVLGFLMSTSMTLGDAFDNVVRFQRIINDGDRLVLIRGKKKARFIFRPVSHAHPAHQHLCEFLFYQFVIGSQSVLGQPFEIYRIRLRHTPREGDTVLEDTFGVPIEFGAPIDELVIPLEVFELELPSHNPNMREFFENHAHELLERLPATNRLRERLRVWVADHLKDGEVDVPRAAKALSMSPRTLQRNLRREGSSMHELVDEVRWEYALAFLEDTANISEVAYRLGYSEPSAFHRAFKRWTGLTPRQYLRYRAAQATE